MTQAEFARAIEVSPTSVSRWVKQGDRPKGEHIDRISDVLVLDYDLVATKAGYRPKELLGEIDPESAKAEALGMVERIDWETDSTRIELLRNVLRAWLDNDAKRDAELLEEG